MTPSDRFSSPRLSSLFRWLVGLSLAAGGVYGSVWVDTGARARASFREAEGFRRWAMDPGAKSRDLEAEFLKASGRLAGRRGRGELTAEDFRLEEDILQARFDMRRAESAAKRAYFAYRDVYRLCSPPETRLSQRARLLAPAAKQAWREDVARRGLPASDLMFDPDPGEEGDQRVVFSTRDGDQAALLSNILRDEGVPAQVFVEERVARAARLGARITVPASDFWRAHARLRALLAPDLPALFVES